MLLTAADRPAARLPWQEERDAVPAPDRAAVALGQAGPDPVALEGTGHDRGHRPARDLGADPSSRRRRERRATERLQPPAGAARVRDRAARRVAGQREHLRSSCRGGAIGDPEVDRTRARRPSGRRGKGGCGEGGGQRGKDRASQGPLTIPRYTRRVALSGKRILITG